MTETVSNEEAIFETPPASVETEAAEQEPKPEKLEKPKKPKTVKSHKEVVEPKAEVVEKAEQDSPVQSNDELALIRKEIEDLRQTLEEERKLRASLEFEARKAELFSQAGLPQTLSNIIAGETLEEVEKNIALLKRTLSQRGGFIGGAEREEQSDLASEIFNRIVGANRRSVNLLFNNEE